MAETNLSELTGKVVAAAKVTRMSPYEQELSLEFADGTSFSFSCMSTIGSESTVYRGGIGEPEIIRQAFVD